MTAVLTLTKKKKIEICIVFHLLEKTKQKITIIILIDYAITKLHI